MTPVWVVGRPAMVVEVGVGALVRRGVDARVWSGGAPPCDGVALLIHHDHDLPELWSLVEEVLSLGRPWVALVGSFGVDAVWALQGVGASTVLRADAGLDAVCAAVAAVPSTAPAPSSTVPPPSSALPVAPAVAASLSTVRPPWVPDLDEPAGRLSRLTPREHEVLTGLGEGRSVQMIARSLGSSPSTVRTQVASVLRKLGVGSQLAAVAALHRAPVGSVAGGPASMTKYEGHQI